MSVQGERLAIVGARRLSGVVIFSLAELAVFFSVILAPVKLLIPAHRLWLSSASFPHPSLELARPHSYLMSANMPIDGVGLTAVGWLLGGACSRTTAVRLYGVWK